MCTHEQVIIKAMSPLVTPREEFWKWLPYLYDTRTCSLSSDRLSQLSPVVWQGRMCRAIKDCLSSANILSHTVIAKTNLIHQWLCLRQLDWLISFCYIYFDDFLRVDRSTIMEQIKTRCSI